jgi:hypothetical protein
MKDHCALISPPHRRVDKHSTRRVHLVLESLEDRCLLSGLPPVGPLPAVTIGLTAAEVDDADVVVDWNATMLQAIKNTNANPCTASRTAAMVGVAVFDAVDGIHTTYDFYDVPGLDLRPSHNASRPAAAIAAADTVLNNLFPTQTPMFDAEFQATVGVLPHNVATAEGLAWGMYVGNSVLAWRSHDGSNATSTYQAAPPGGPIGAYELTPNAGLEGKPPGFLPALDPQWGQVTPWTMTSANQFLPAPPPAVGSAEYAAAFNEVKALGDTNSTTRTQDEYDFAHFWADVPGHSVTPPGHWDEIAEHLSLQTHLSLEQNAHLFAEAGIGMADAAINCWNAKYVYNYWRPITAIRDPRASQINPANTSDPNWTPLWNTPNFPSYTSGHSTFSGAASTILASIFGNDIHFTIGSDDMPGYSRSFTSLSDAADEAGESRVVGGIHFSFDNTAGLKAGREIGQYIVEHFLTRDDHDHDDRGDDGDPSFGRGDGDITFSNLLTLAGPGAASLLTQVQQQTGQSTLPPGREFDLILVQTGQNTWSLVARSTGEDAHHAAPLDLTLWSFDVPAWS